MFPMGNTRRLRDIAAQNVRAEIARRNLPASELAKKMRLSPSAMSKRLNGHVPFTVEELAQIGNQLGMNPEDLLKGWGSAA